MAKKLISVLAASVILLVGCYEENDATISYSQIPVCSIEAEFDQYAVMKYVVNRDIIIPALEQKFIPQGIAYWVKKDWLILSGYYRPEEKGASATLLAVNATTGKLEGAYSVSDRSGEKIEGHFSGIAVAEKDLYLTHGTYLLQIPLRSLELPSNRGKLFVARKHKIGIKDGSCNYSDDILWVCEHYREADIQFDNRTPGYGRMVGYRMDRSGSPVPYCIFLVPEKVQGTTFASDGKLVLSTSYGRTNASEIFVYDDPRAYTPDGYALVEEHEVPVWILNNATMKLSAPPMSEGCCTVGNSIYLLFESAAYYYRAFDPHNRSVDPTDRVWKIQLS